MGGQIPAEPRLQAVTAELLPRGISGKELSQLEDAWLPLLQPFPWNDDQAESLKLRGRLLFGVGAQLLGGQASDVEGAGALWSLVDGAHHCSDAESRDNLLDHARSLAAALPSGTPTPLRALTVLGALAASDLKNSGGLGRAVAALTHRIAGRFPH